jgi:HlyD family secretion protein
LVDVGRLDCAASGVIVAAVGVVAHGSGTKIDPSRLAKVTRGDIAKSVVATGKIQPITKVELKSKASGIVEKLYVDINQHVTKGQVLAQLDQQEILAQVAAQKAQLEAASGECGHLSGECRPGQSERRGA